MKSKTLPPNGVVVHGTDTTLKLGDVVYLDRKPQKAGRIIALIDRGYSTMYSVDDPAAHPNNNRWYRLGPTVVILCPDGMLRSGAYPRLLQDYIGDLQAQVDNLNNIKDNSNKLDVDEWDVEDYVREVTEEVEAEFQS